MRITGGRLRGRKLKFAPDKQVRPTTERIRHSLFDILAPYLITRTTFLDLFAGSGIMGLEALSRGIGHVLFVEKHFHSFKTLNANINYLKLTQFTDTFLADAVKILPEIIRRFPVDMIYLDPPYASRLAGDVFREILRLPCRENLILIHEFFFKNESNPETDKMICFREQRYGDTQLNFWKFRDIGGSQ